MPGFLGKSSFHSFNWSFFEKANDITALIFTGEGVTLKDFNH